VDVGVVLGGRDDAVGFDHFALLVGLHVVVKHASRGFDGSGGGSGFWFVSNAEVVQVVVEQLVDDRFGAGYDVVALDELGDVVHEGVVADRLEAERRRRFLGSRMELVVVVVEPRQRSGGGGFAAYLRELRGREIHGIFVRHQQIIVLVAHHAVGRDEVAADEGVALAVAQGDELRFAHEVRNRKRHEKVGGAVEHRTAVGDHLPDFGEALL